jgi:hypothetical protein
MPEIPISEKDLNVQSKWSQLYCIWGRYLNMQISLPSHPLQVGENIFLPLPLKGISTPLRTRVKAVTQQTWLWQEVTKETQWVKTATSLSLKYRSSTLPQGPGTCYFFCSLLPAIWKTCSSTSLLLHSNFTVFLRPSLKQVPHTHTLSHTLMYTHSHTHANTHIYRHIHTCTHTHTHTHIHNYTYTHTHIHTHTHTHTHTQILYPLFYFSL